MYNRVKHNECVKRPKIEHSHVTFWHILSCEGVNKKTEPGVDLYREVAVDKVGGSVDKVEGTVDRESTPEKEPVIISP